MITPLNIVSTVNTCVSKVDPQRPVLNKKISSHCGSPIVVAKRWNVVRGTTNKRRQKSVCAKLICALYSLCHRCIPTNQLHLLIRYNNVFKKNCMLNHVLEWYKWVLTSFDHDRLIPPSHETAAVTVDAWLHFMLEWTREVNTTLYNARHPLYYYYYKRIWLECHKIRCRDRRYEWDGEISLTLAEKSSEGRPVIRPHTNKVKYLDLYSASTQTPLTRSDVDHTVLPANNAISAFTPSRRVSPPSALIAPTHGDTDGWPGWVDLNGWLDRDKFPAPIPVLTGPGVE